MDEREEQVLLVLHCDKLLIEFTLPSNSSVILSVASLLFELVNIFSKSDKSDISDNSSILFSSIVELLSTVIFCL